MSSYHFVSLMPFRINVLKCSFFFHHHSLHNNDLGPQLLVDGKDMYESESEDHEVQGQHCPPRLVHTLHHSAKAEKRTWTLAELLLSTKILF